jgi:hypothetical protein
MKINIFRKILLIGFLVVNCTNTNLSEDEDTEQYHYPW